jgi:hypothetical protein
LGLAAGELAVNGITFNQYLGGLHSAYVRGAAPEYARLRGNSTH